MTPQQLRARADALDALRPGRRGYGGDGYDEHPARGVWRCSACMVSNIDHPPDHFQNCRNVALSAALHDGAQALRRLEWVMDRLAEGNDEDDSLARLARGEADGTN